MPADEQNDQVDGAPAAAKVPELPDHVEAVIAAWWSSTVETLGPLVTTQAYNALGVAHANLRTQLATALR
jgi:hypothetical protein